MLLYIHISYIIHVTVYTYLLHYPCYCIYISLTLSMLMYIHISYIIHVNVYTYLLHYPCYCIYISLTLSMLMLGCYCIYISLTLSMLIYISFIHISHYIHVNTIYNTLTSSAWEKINIYTKVNICLYDTKLINHFVNYRYMYINEIFTISNWA